jgi:predicted RNase H-like HicB family nuclease
LARDGMNVWFNLNEICFEISWPKGEKVTRYAVIIEKAGENYSAYLPDLPGCVATGPTVKAVEDELREAIRFHVAGLKEDGLAVPEPTSIADYIEAWGHNGAGIPRGRPEGASGSHVKFPENRENNREFLKISYDSNLFAWCLTPIVELSKSL